MLLCNLSKSENVCFKLLDLSTPSKNVSGEENDVSSPRPNKDHLDNLIELFARGEGKKYNPHAEYDFLGGVFANISLFPEGREYFTQNSRIDSTPRLSKIIPYTSHPSVIRRGGAVSTLKNVCFDIHFHTSLLNENKLNVLPYLLLPLAGPEEYDEDDVDGMPEELQFLEPTKQRESDAKIRAMLLEALLLLTTSREGRDVQRTRKVYPIIKFYHLWEKDEICRELAERLVNMIMGEEAKEEDDTNQGLKIQEIEQKEEELQELEEI